MIDINRPRHEVAVYVTDPNCAPDWYANLERVTWQDDKRLRLAAPAMAAATRRANQRIWLR